MFCSSKSMLEFVHFKPGIDTTRLHQTCKSLWNITHSKTLWIHLLNCARWYRPVVLPSPIDELPVDELRDSVTKSMKLDHMLARDTMGDPIRIWELVPPSGTALDQTAKNGNELQVWASPLADGRHLLSMSNMGLMSLWDMLNNNVLATIKMSTVPWRWEHSIDIQGVTIIVGTIYANG
jgi:hypothetical protein